MTVTNNQSKYTYNGNGTTGPWNYPRYFIQNADIQVIKTSAAGVETILTGGGTDYTMTGAGNPSGGFATTTAVVAIGEKITLVGNVDYTQPDVYPETGDMPAKTIERGLDRAVMMIQQIREAVTRCLQLPVSSSITNFQIATPLPNCALVYNSTGNGVQNGPTVSQISNAETNAASAAASAAAAAASVATIGNFDLSGTPAANDGMLWDTGTSKFIRRTLAQLRDAIVPFFNFATPTVQASIVLAEATNNGAHTLTIRPPAALAADVIVEGVPATRDGTETLTNKTIILNQGTNPLPTAEGDIRWDTDDNRIVVGDGTGQAIFLPRIVGTVLRTTTMAFNAGGNTTSTTFVNAAGANFSYTPISTNSIIRIEMEASCAIALLAATNTYIESQIHEVTGTATAIGQMSRLGVGTGSGGNATDARQRLTAEVSNTALTARSFNWRHRTTNAGASAASTNITCIITEIQA